MCRGKYPQWVCDELNGYALTGIILEFWRYSHWRPSVGFEFSSSFRVYIIENARMPEKKLSWLLFPTFMDLSTVVSCGSLLVSLNG